MFIKVGSNRVIEAYGVVSVSLFILSCLSVVSSIMSGSFLLHRRRILFCIDFSDINEVLLGHIT